MERGVIKTWEVEVDGARLSVAFGSEAGAAAYAASCCPAGRWRVVRGPDCVGGVECVCNRCLGWREAERVLLGRRVVMAA